MNLRYLKKLTSQLGFSFKRILKLQAGMNKTPSSFFVKIFYTYRHLKTSVSSSKEFIKLLCTFKNKIVTTKIIWFILFCEKIVFSKYFRKTRTNHLFFVVVQLYFVRQYVTIFPNAFFCVVSKKMAKNYDLKYFFNLSKINNIQDKNLFSERFF